MAQRSLLQRSVILYLTTLMIGCGGEDSSVKNPEISVAVLPASTSILKSTSAVFRATVSGASNTAVNWSVKEGPAGGSIDSKGVYRAPANQGTFHVIAKSVADPSKSATATVSVLDSHPTRAAVRRVLSVDGKILGTKERSKNQDKEIRE